MDSYMGAGAFPKWGTHTVEIDLQWGEYKATVQYQQGGNCLGGSVLKDAVDALVERELEPVREEDYGVIDWDEDNGEIREIRLFKEDGSGLVIDDDFGDIIVGARIIGWEEEKRG